MKQRRRLGTTKSRPVTATLLALSLCASAAVGIGGNKILVTQGDAIDPVEVAVQSDAFTAGENILVNDPAIATQGDGQNSERLVKEFTREQPFSLFAVTWTGDRDFAVFVRAEKADGTWSEWYNADPLNYGSDDPNATRGTDLVYVEPTTKVQVAINNVDLVDGTGAEGLDVVFMDGGESELPENGVELTADTDGMPKVISRAGWGANESIRCKNPSYDNSLGGIAIHHTAGSNNYTQAQAPGIVRGIYQYHAKNLGWCDVGYHVLADKYGNLYEGRYGGLNKNVRGVHAGGFNANTWAISMMGNYDTVQPTETMIRSVGEMAGWRAKVAKLDPTGTGTHYSEGSSYTFYPQGTRVQLPNIFAHRDVGNTACPGQYAYARMGDIRTYAKTKYNSIGTGGIFSNPTTTPAETTTPSANPTPNTNTTNTGDSAATTLLLSRALGSSGDGDLQSLLTAAVPLIALALGVATSQGLISGDTKTIGNVEVVDGLKLDQISNVLNAVAAFDTDSDIKKAYNAVAPILGALRTGEITYTNGNAREIAYALFDNGIIVDSEETGAQALWGVIGDTWAAQGFDMGPLGLPLNQEYYDGNLIRVDFEGGYITFDPATSAVNVQANQ